MSDFSHITVLANELADGLNLKLGSIAIDCTAGGGGHTQLLSKAVGSEGKVIAIDQDPSAIKTLESRFKEEIAAGSIIVRSARFSQIKEICEELNIVGRVDGIAADLGVSSPQLDQAERGFSFSKDGPLDMRMNPSSKDPSAMDVVASASQEELKRIFIKYGEEPKAHFIAQAICKYREDKKIETTSQLAEIVDGAVHYKTRSKKHPATKVFQALRIHVNRELQELETLLQDSFELLSPGGRLGIIGFHSLEDKLVKYMFKELAVDPQSLIPKDLPITVEQLSKLGTSQAKIIRPFPVNATNEEIEENPRSRSAKLRIIEKSTI